MVSVTGLDDGVSHTTPIDPSIEIVGYYGYMDDDGFVMGIGLIGFKHWLFTRGDGSKDLHLILHEDLEAGAFYLLNFVISNRSKSCFNNFLFKIFSNLFFKVFTIIYKVKNVK